ncbi:hypothetical protein [Clostridium intestinale]|uniref:hypothetical protein n=1 Tax=Clostridium intestinale TaxID=36845 RepID=UPI002DD62406|nr:hypothetical protein [Clostridium intestinale]WRY53717.1 hypothetical protein P8F83_11000 [Clostridium intestinale]
MIMFWNQREVFIGNSLENFNRAQHLLQMNNINYKIKLSSNNSPNLIASRRATMGIFGENSTVSTMYYIYVHKNDYDEACYLLNAAH